MKNSILVLLVFLMLPTEVHSQGASNQVGPGAPNIAGGGTIPSGNSFIFTNPNDSGGYLKLFQQDSGGQTPTPLTIYGGGGSMVIINNTNVPAASNGSFTQGNATFPSYMLELGQNTLQFGTVAPGGSYPPTTIMQLAYTGPEPFWTFYTQTRFQGWTDDSAISEWKKKDGTIVDIIDNLGKMQIGGTAGPATTEFAVNGGTLGNSPTTGTASTASTRLQTSTAVLDIGINSSGTVWLQSSLAADLSTKNAIALNQNGGGVIIGSTATPTRALEIYGIANNYAEGVFANTTTGQSYGTFIKAGTNSSDAALTVQNTSAGQLFQIRGDGAIFTGSTIGVSCTIVGATAHLTVVNGIVTLCN